MVFGLSITTLLSSSISEEPKPQSTQSVQPASPTAWPSAKPAGWFVLWSAWHSSRKPSKSPGTPSKPASFTQDLR